MWPIRFVLKGYFCWDEDNGDVGRLGLKNHEWVEVKSVSGDVGLSQGGGS